MNWNHLYGLLPIGCGVFGMLMAKGVLPRKPADPEKMALWRRKFGKLVLIVGPIVILFGILQLLGFMDGHSRIIIRL